MHAIGLGGVSVLLGKTGASAGSSLMDKSSGMNGFLSGSVRPREPASSELPHSESQSSGIDSNLIGAPDRLVTED